LTLGYAMEDLYMEAFQTLFESQYGSSLALIYVCLHVLAIKLIFSLSHISQFLALSFF